MTARLGSGFEKPSVAFRKLVPTTSATIAIARVCAQHNHPVAAGVMP
jgi:hypothetical protein